MSRLVPQKGELHALRCRSRWLSSPAVCAGGLAGPFLLYIGGVAVLRRRFLRAPARGIARRCLLSQAMGRTRSVPSAPCFASLFCLLALRRTVAGGCLCAARGRQLSVCARLPFLFIGLALCCLAVGRLRPCCMLNLAAIRRHVGHGTCCLTRMCVARSRASPEY